MSLSIGKIARLFGISPETLRYYEQEGFLSPRKNEENGYREYDFEDLFLLTDLLFYRDIGIPVRDIKDIFGGMKVDAVSDLIREKKQEIRHKIKRLERSLTKLENWEQLHRESLRLLNQYDIRPMPVALRCKTAYDNYVKMLATFQNDAHTDRDLPFFLTFSFFCDLKDENARLHRYIVLDKSVAKNLSFEFVSTELVEESAPACLFTVVKYQPDADAMLAPLLLHAKELGLRLTGEVYGRLSIIYYGSSAPQEYYRIYAILSDDSPAVTD